jgi:carboxypeptidase C (cathepsin A)
LERKTFVIRSVLGLLPLTALALAASPLAAGGNDKHEDKPTGDATSPPPTTPPKAPEPPEESPVISKHEVRIGERTLTYDVTAGLMPLKNEKGETEARLYFTAYTVDTPGGAKDRPLMFSFNGGPGSSSVWLHLGGLGPRRVRMLDDGAMPAPPFRLVDNEYTWLEQTDLVFVDPVDTGYSRAATPELAKQYCGVQKDLESVGEFIRLYLSRYGRWASPLFLVGESYGTFRAAGLSGLLIEKGIAFNGVVLVSSVLDLLTLRFDPGNDLPYILYLPSYAATAWYHHRLPADLQERELSAVLAEVEAWAAGDYTLALAKGAALTGDDRGAVVERLARYTGLSPRYVEQSNLRIEIRRFCKELLRDEGRTVGRLDSRYTGFDTLGVTERPDFDPSLSAIRPPYTAMLNDYIGTQLGYKTDAEYHILRSLEWDWGSAGEGYAKTAVALASAFAKNPYLHLFIASGYFDLATPYFATDYTLRHLPLDAPTRTNIRTEEYPVGHMVYLEKNVLAKLQTDVGAFIAGALSSENRPLRRR